MAKQETVISKKRRGPAPTGKGEPVLVRLQPPSLAALDSWREKQPDEPSRPEAIRRLVDSALKGNSGGNGITEKGRTPT